MTIGKLLSLGLIALSLGCSLHELDYLETPAEDEGSEIRDDAPGENAPMLLVDNAGVRPTSAPTDDAPSLAGDASPAPEAGANVAQAGDEATDVDTASEHPTDDVGVADGSLGAEAQTNLTTLLGDVGADAGSADSCGFSPGPASCSDGERSSCAIKGASCEALATRLGCQPQALCRWPSAGDEAECRALTLLGAWSPSDGPFAAIAASQSFMRLT